MFTSKGYTSGIHICEFVIKDKGNGKGCFQFGLSPLSCNTDNLSWFASKCLYGCCNLNTVWIEENKTFDDVKNNDTI